MTPAIERALDDYDGGTLSRRGLLAALAGALAAGDAEAQPDATFQASELDHVALSVTDVARSREFYERHLGLRTTSAGSYSSFLSCGPHFLALFRSPQPGLAHYCYSVPGYTPGDAVARLEAAGLTPKRRGNRVYFDDPDGIEVQVSAPNR
jgi:catechol-2,3-dioxygenase